MLRIDDERIARIEKRGWVCKSEWDAALADLREARERIKALEAALAGKPFTAWSQRTGYSKT